MTEPTTFNLIHPDCDDPAAEFEGYLDELVRQARHHPNQPVDDGHLMSMLEQRVNRLTEQAGG